MGLYILFTVKTTAWRTKFRKQANAADNKAATIIIDSLINYEAVKVHQYSSYANTALQQREISSSII